MSAVLEPDLAHLSVELRHISSVLAAITEADRSNSDALNVCRVAAAKVVVCLNEWPPDTAVGTEAFRRTLWSTISPLIDFLDPSTPAAPSREDLRKLCGVLSVCAAHARFLGRASAESLAHAERFRKHRVARHFGGTSSSGYRGLIHEFRQADANLGQTLFGLEMMTTGELHRRRLEIPEELLPGHEHVYTVAADRSVEQFIVVVPVMMGSGVDSQGRDIREKMFLKSSVAADEFAWLAKQAGAHVPRSFRDAMPIDANDPEHVWLTCLLWNAATSEPGSLDDVPGTRRLLSGRPFTDSADFIERRGLATGAPRVPPPPHAIGQGDAAAPLQRQAVSSEVADAARTKRKLGRPRGYDSKNDEKIAADWTCAKGLGTLKSDFADRKGIAVADLDKLLSRVRNRRNRAPG